MALESRSAGDTAVIVVDVQADFTELRNGSLAVPGTDAAYVEAVERATREFREKGLLVYATQDWHPEDHVSFYTNHPGREPFDVIDIGGRTQVLWPPHCVQGTPGAEILIPSRYVHEVIRKGTDPRFDSYSGFKDDRGKETGLHDLLRNHGIEALIVYGLATDYCVRFTVVDALDTGYRVRVVTPLCRGVAEDTTRQALEEMRDRGAVLEE